jgi:hypothetical protein
MKCVWCDKHQFMDKHGNESDHHHWCSKYNKTCYSVYKLCDELKKRKEIKHNGSID